MKINTIFSLFLILGLAIQAVISIRSKVKYYLINNNTFSPSYVMIQMKSAMRLARVIVIPLIKILRTVIAR